MSSESYIELQERVPLAPFTTLKIGGPARFFVSAETEEQIIATVMLAENRDLPLFILGGGSNIVVSDAGFDGLVLQICNAGILPAGSAASRGRLRAERSPDSRKDAGVTFITVAAGEDWDRFVAYCVESDLAGVECLSGIPGLVGATPVQNVGAYGQEVAESIVSVRCFDRVEKRPVEFSNSECGFEYRKSIFNSTARDRYIVLSVTFALTKAGNPKIAYKDLRDLFPDRIPSLRETREGVLAIRRSKSMVIDPNDPNSRSAGSFFKNPIIGSDRADPIKQAAGTDNLPMFPAMEGKIKIPAAWLIEQAGFGKGYRLGRTGISTKHSLALVNLGGATAAEIIELKESIQDAVAEKFKILLEPEPIFIGFQSD